MGSVMKHIMLDIETLGTEPGSAILTIGLAHFDPARGVIVDSTEFRCTQASQEALERAIDPATVKWWGQQSQEAQDRLTEPPLYDDVGEMLKDVWSWMNGVCASQWDLAVWAKGPGFDQVLCRDLAKQVGQKWKGHFSRDMCVRTMLLIAKAKGWGDILAMENTLAHGAEADAVHQANQVMEVMRRIKA